MRRIACVLALAALCIGLPAAQSRAGNGWHGGGGHGGGGHGGGWHGGGWHGGTHVAVGIGVAPGWGWGGWGWGPGWGWGWGPGWGYGYGPGWYAPAYAYPAYPPVQQPPPQYIEQSAPTGYWYFCPSAGDYYPRVRSCPEPWEKVAPTPE